MGPQMSELVWASLMPGYEHGNEFSRLPRSEDERTGTALRLTGAG
jgi:hypothetical protein